MRVIKEERFIAALNREAKLYIGLPDDYDKTSSHYPVLYMHDGQNVFFESDAFVGKTWEVKEAFEDHQDLPDLIVVALSSADGDERLNEYGPYSFGQAALEEFDLTDIGGKGKQYIDYLVNELKPEIDERFRTKKAADVTAIMGASMGGVISLYAGLVYPNIFGLIASLSGSYFVSKEAFINEIAKANIDMLKKVYMDTGDAEVAGGDEEDYVMSNLDVFEALKEKLPNQRLEFQVISGGKHTETDWAKRFPNIVRTLYK